MSSATRWLAYCAALFALLASCDPRITQIGDEDAGSGVYLEAESGKLSEGIVTVSDPQTSGGRYITPTVGATTDTPPGPARAVYEIHAKTAGTYHIWGRIHGQGVDSNRFFFQMDGMGDWITWRITTGDVWFWDVLHDNVKYGIPYNFELSAGTHELVLSNAVDNVGLDRLYYASDGSKPEGNETMCNPPHSVQLDGICNPSCGSMIGQCGGAPCVGLPTMPTYDCPTCCIPDQ